MQGLASLVLKPVEESDMSPVDTGISAVAPLLPSHHWLLVRLPSLPLFECIKMNICSDLRHVSIVILFYLFSHFQCEVAFAQMAFLCANELLRNFFLTHSRFLNKFSFFWVCGTFFNRFYPIDLQS